MTKKELIKYAAQEAGIKDQEADKLLAAVLRGMAQSLRRGENVCLQNFGTFKAVRKNERQGRNPKTGRSITIPAKTVVKFKSSVNLIMEEL